MGIKITDEQIAYLQSIKKKNKRMAFLLDCIFENLTLKENPKKQRLFEETKPLQKKEYAPISLHSHFLEKYRLNLNSEDFEIMKDNFSVSESDKQHLKFMYERTAGVYNQDRNLDYMVRFKEIIDSL